MFKQLFLVWMVKCKFYCSNVSCQGSDVCLLYCLPSKNEMILIKIQTSCLDSQEVALLWREQMNHAYTTLAGILTQYQKLKFIFFKKNLVILFIYFVCVCIFCLEYKSYFSRAGQNIKGWDTINLGHKTRQIHQILCFNCFRDVVSQSYSHVWLSSVVLGPGILSSQHQQVRYEWDISEYYDYLSSATISATQIFETENLETF